MDPISAAASIIGLVGAAAKISESLFKFIRSVKDAPKLASSVLQEVSDTSACLSQLQTYLMGTKTTSRSHENLLMVEQIVVALSHCVLVFSELEEIVDSLKPSDPMQSGRLAQWVLKERTIKDLFTRLHNSKVSLNLMVTTLTCASIGEAQRSVSELATLVAQVLESNQEISRRMARLEQQSVGKSPSTIPTITGRDANSSPSVTETNTAEDNESIVTIKELASDFQNGENSEPRRTFGFAFDQDLNRSRPYRQAMKRHTVLSTASSEIHTMGWSCLSDLSLAEVSHISVINLPFCPQELWNGHRFDSVGFVHSKSHRKPSTSPTAPLTLTSRSRLETRVRAGKKGGNLSMIKEDMGVPVPAKSIKLLGKGFSGKTTVFNHLQILYGNGISNVERLVAFEDIVRDLIQIFLKAWSICSDQCSQDVEDRGEAGEMVHNIMYFQTLVRAAADLDLLTNEVFDRTCQQAFLHFWNREEVRDMILYLDRSKNVPYLIENLEQVFAPDQVVSNTIFLRAHHRGAGIYRQPINIDHTQYQILDPSMLFWRLNGYLSDVDVLIFVVPLTSYYEFPLENYEKNRMAENLELFAELTKRDSLKSTPFIILLNKFDLFEKSISSKPVRDYFPTYSGSPDPSSACSFFANEFLTLDERPSALFRIYRTSAVDRDLFKATMDSIASWLS